MKLKVNEEYFIIPYKEIKKYIVDDTMECYVNYSIDKSLIKKDCYTLTFSYIPHILYYWRRSNSKYEVELNEVILELTKETSSIEIDDNFEAFLKENKIEYFKECLSLNNVPNVIKKTTGIGIYDSRKDMLNNEFIQDLIKNMKLDTDDKKERYLEQLYKRPY